MIKELKTKNRIRSAILLTLFMLVGGVLFSQPISGPAFIFNDGQPNSYSRPTAGPFESYGSWTFGTFPHVVITPNGDNITVTAGPLATVCSFELSYVHSFFTNQNVFINSTVERLLITILPTIIVPPIYPGENATISLVDNCIHTGCNYLWNVSPAAVCPSCGPLGTTTQGIYINPTITIPEFVNVNCTMSNCTAPALSSEALKNVIITVALRTPTISGPSQIGCVGTAPASNFTFASTVPLGAASFSWSVPGFLTITGGQGTRTLEVVENAIGTGVIQVQAMASGSPVKSAVASFPVQVCCRSNINITNNVGNNTTDQQQSALTLTASNIIVNTASAMYHTGGTMYLQNGFNALPGSYFHGYIQACTGSYNRLANSEEETESADVYETKLPEMNGSGNYDAPDRWLYVVPNPTSGTFKVRTQNNPAYPTQIVIRDIQGSTIKTLSGIHTFENEFDLSPQPAGLYMVSIYYNDKVISKRIVKN